MVIACAESCNAVGCARTVRGDANTASSVTRTGEPPLSTSRGIVTLAETSSHHQSQCATSGDGGQSWRVPNAPHVSQRHQSRHASKSSHHEPLGGARLAERGRSGCPRRRRRGGARAHARAGAPTDAILGALHAARAIRGCCLEPRRRVIIAAAWGSRADPTGPRRSSSTSLPTPFAALARLRSARDAVGVARKQTLVVVDGNVLVMQTPAAVDTFAGYVAVLANQLHGAISGGRARGGRLRRAGRDDARQAGGAARDARRAPQTPVCSRTSCPAPPTTTTRPRRSAWTA